MKKNKQITIIGGGIGGLTMANALQKSGIGFDLYEQSPDLTDVGAGIGLSQAALEILDRFGLGEDVRENGVKIRNVFLAGKQLNIRRTIAVRQESYVIHRAVLIGILKSNLPSGAIHLSKQASDVRSHPDFAEVIFSDGTSAESPCVIAADGIHSVLRSKLYPEIGIRYINQTIWRGITKLDVPERMRDSFFEVWDEGLRFLTVPYNDDETFWLAVKPSPPGLTDDPSVIREELAGLFGNFHPVFKDLIQNSRSFLRNDMADLGTAKHPWHHNRVVFLGDSIHATTPNLAQGGCQAIESALCLALCLKSDTSSYEQAFNLYRRMRMDKVSFIIRMSWRFGIAAHSQNPFLHYLYRFIMEYSPAAFMEFQEKKLNDISYLKKFNESGILFAHNLH